MIGAMIVEDEGTWAGTIPCQSMVNRGNRLQPAR